MMMTMMTMRFLDDNTGLWQRAEPSFLLPDIGVGTKDITQLDRATKISGNKDIERQILWGKKISGNNITQLDRATKILEDKYFGEKYQAIISTN